MRVRSFDLLLLVGCLNFRAFAQATPTVKQAPPAGIPVPATDATQLKSLLRDLGTQIQNLRTSLASKADLLRLLPDVEIFHKAVHDALAYDEFFKPSELMAAKAQLTTGLQRAEELRNAHPSWTTARGPVVRAYRSKIDNSVQPYGLQVPDDWSPDEKQPRPLYLWFHGRNDTLSEVAFIAGQTKGGREFAPANAFELHLYGRYCNASKFAGEVDAFEAMDDVKRHHLIDTNRIAELGFSMGGATAWHMAAHHAGLWAAASPGAGFAETAIYAKVFDNKKEPPQSWEQKLWHLYDATDYAANFANLPLIAYSGEIDPQKQSADIMEEALAREGLKLERLIGPKTAHKYEPETKKVLSRRIDQLVATGRDSWPRHVHFVTYTLRYNQMAWITIDRLEKHWERGEIDAQLEGETLRVKTRNVAAFTINLPEKPNIIVVDGETVAKFGGKSLCKLGKWQGSPPDYGAGLHKHHGLTGPIDDAFMDSFIFVRPTGPSWNEKVGAWSESELQRAITEWRRVFRGDARLKSDTEITADDIAHHNLILWGDPGSNQVLAKIIANLPLKWTRSDLTLGGPSVPAADHAPILIYPNPLNPEHYIVLNSSFTFRQGSTTSNSLQTPKLPDWAIIDLRTPPSLKWPGLVTSAGFFDDLWKL
jgi:hypothetical protein